jgi:hypothetical protein
MDVIIYPLAFGGRAFEPVTDKGKVWCEDVLSRNPDYPVFRSPDGCMAGFSDEAFGVEPQDFEAFADDARDAGLELGV